MKFKITPNKLTGNPDPSGWVVSSDFTPANDISLKSHGRLIALISMISQNDSKLAEKEDLIIGREILTRFHELYYNQQGDKFQLLNQAAGEIEKSFSSPNQELQILLAIFLEGKVMIASFGKVQAWVLRNNKLARVLNSGKILNSAAGLLEDKDVFFFGTDVFFERITPEFLKTETDFSLVKDLESTFGMVSVTVDKEEEIQEIVERPQAAIVNPIKRISPARIFAARLIDKILNLLPSQNIYVKEEIGNPESSNKKKISSMAGAILLVLLLLSIIFGIRQNKISSSKAKYEPILTSVQHDLSEAEGLSALNNARARDLILTAKNEINDLKKQKINDPRITDLSAKIESDLGSIAGIYQDEPSQYLDLTLINNSFKGDDIAASDDRMVVLDKAGKRLETIDIATSKADPVAGPDIMPNALAVSAYADRNFVTSNNGVWDIGAKAEVVIPQDKDVGTNVLVAAYTGNFYILDKNNSAIWRYQGDGGTFGPKANWFGAGIKPDLSQVVSWTIDGNIWMLTSDSTILRFSGGSPIDFSLKNMDKDPMAIDIFTTQDSKYLYLLDKGNSKILVINKDDGSYKAQYLSDNIKSATKIVVSETSKKIILLEGSKLYSLDIKHL